MNNSDLKRFSEFVDTTEECWTWTGCCSTGYGSFRCEGKTVLAHRFAWEATFGNIPDDMQVLHRCNNKLCVRTDHLYLGTQKTNVLDSVRDGLRGTKLTRNEVIGIRAAARLTSVPHNKLAEMFGVNKSHISSIISRQKWAWLEEGAKYE